MWTLRFIKDIAPAGILFGLFWCGNRICTLPPELWQAKVIHSLGLYVFFTVTMAFVTYAIPYEKISWKMLFLFLFMALGAATILYVCVQSYLAINFTWAELEAQYKENADIALERILPGTKLILDSIQPAFYTLLCFIIYKVRRLDISKSDKPNNDNMLIVFVYPKNWTGILLLIFWKLPVTTIKLYYKGFLYGFDKDIGRLIKEKASFKDLEGRFVRDTKLNDTVEKILFDLIDVKWSIKRNCLNIFEPVIGKVTNYI